MSDELLNDLIYVCSLIEYTARKTDNHRGVIVACLGEKGIDRQLKDAQVNHCLSFEQVSDEIIERYDIPTGDFDTITGCKYSIPGYVDIGKLYVTIIRAVNTADDWIKTIIEVFSSFLSDEISKFYTDVYYQNPDYLIKSYEAGYLLE